METDSYTFKRSWTKSSKERVGDSAMLAVLRSYRTTPSPTLEGKFPAELLLVFQPRGDLELLQLKTVICKFIGNEGKVNNFNKHHGAKVINYNKDQFVYFRQYLRNQEVWKRGKIVKRIGKVMYLVEDEQQRTHSQHANQMQPQRDLSNDKAHGCVSIEQNSKPESSIADKTPDSILGNNDIIVPDQVVSLRLSVHYYLFLGILIKFC